jgi:competence protein ComEC
VTTGRESVIGDLERSAKGAGAALIARVADATSADAPGRLESVAAALRAEASAQLDRWPLWTPVAFGAGCGLYFGLRSEPAAWVVFAVAAAVIVAAIAVRWTHRRSLIIAMTLVACLAAGVGAAKLREERVAAPLAPASRTPVTVEGWLIDVAGPGARGDRILMAPVWIEGLRPEQTPIRLRVTLSEPAPPPGTPLRVRAILNPPPPPASPGAYDFGRNSWFESVGGVGFALGKARATVLPEPPWRLELRMRINAWRWDLANRIVERLGPRQGGVAAAMTTGHEAWISEEDQEAMRASGLSHILSISGLHMAIVGGFVFFAVRLLIACWPWLALRVSGKKAAAWAGLVAVGAYLVVSGSPAPAERAAITAAVAFVAVLLDRRAVSFNALAVAAFAVLLLRPESVVQPGFQMSFAATTALVALAEIWPRRISEIETPWPITLFQRGVAWLGAAMAVSFVAGLATGPFAIQHFNRTASYGLLANLLESPISTFVTMPALALGAALEPLGLGAPFLAVAGWGVEATLGIAAWVSRLPFSTMTIPSAPTAALAVSFLGLLFVCVWKGRLRWLGLPFAAAVLLWPRPEPPDVWIAADGSNAAVKAGREALVLRPDAKAFAADLWSRRRGLEIAEPHRVAEDFGCDRFSCRTTGEGPRIGAWWGLKAPDAVRLEALCRNAELVILRPTVERLPAGCGQALVLDGTDFAAGGSIELWRREGRWLGQWSADLRGARPWNPRPPAAGGG